MNGGQIQYRKQMIGRKYQFKVTIPLGLFHRFMVYILQTSLNDSKNKWKNTSFIGIQELFFLS